MSRVDDPKLLELVAAATEAAEAMLRAVRADQRIGRQRTQRELIDAGTRLAAAITLLDAEAV